MKVACQAHKDPEKLKGLIDHFVFCFCPDEQVETSRYFKPHVSGFTTGKTDDHQLLHWF